MSSLEAVIYSSDLKTPLLCSDKSYTGNNTTLTYWDKNNTESPITNIGFTIGSNNNCIMTTKTCNDLASNSINNINSTNCYYWQY